MSGPCIEILYTSPAEDTVGTVAAAAMETRCTVCLCKSSDHKGDAARGHGGIVTPLKIGKHDKTLEWPQ